MGASQSTKLILAYLSTPDRCRSLGLSDGGAVLKKTVHNPDFNSGEFAIIRNQAGLNSYKLSVKEWGD